MVEKQKSLSGGYALSKQQLQNKVRYSKTLYNRRGEGYEETFRDLMHYHVIDPNKIQDVNDFREIVNHMRKDGAYPISENLVDALEQTMEYKEMVIEKIRYQEIQLKSGSRKGLLTEDGNGYFHYDKYGRFHVRDKTTGRYIKTPDYYGLLPIESIIV
jgi:hypothetical protein